MAISEPSAPQIADLGHSVGEIPVKIGPRFLELFSSNLYTSPNKAFEELVTNSWDAGASSAYIGVPEKPKSSDAVVWILDNGESMDALGLAQLWTVGESAKRKRKSARAQIGKFGIGKLATYILADRLTYVCKAKDGVIRLVEMDYTRIEGDENANINLLRPQDDETLKLDLHELAPADLSELYDRLGDAGGTIRELLEAGVPRAAAGNDPYADEFGGESESAMPELSDTWTLVVMTSLKSAGQKMQPGRIRFMLQAALPLGRAMSMIYNGEALKARLENVEEQDARIIGPGLDIDQVTVEASDEPDDFGTLPDIDAYGGKKRKDGRRVVYDYAVNLSSTPYPRAEISGIPGEITGRYVVYKEPVTGRKAEDYSRSHGYFVNVRGRVVNSGEDAYFGLKNLNHTAWAHFRATVRADGLDDALTVNRESLKGSDHKVEIFRAFLRALFNKARGTFDQPPNVGRLSEAGSKLSDSWGAIPLQSFRSALNRFAESPDKLPPEIIADNIEDIGDEIRTWNEESKRNPGSLIKEVKFVGRGGDKPLYNYDLKQRVIVVNLDHPFAQEHGGKFETKELLGSAAVAEILSDAHLAHIGVPQEDIADYQRYRDEMLRIVVKLTRRSGATIAAELLQSTDDKDRLEDLAFEALSFLGFIVKKKGGNGKPDGVARSPVARSAANPARPYSFTYDAKSSKSGKVKTKDLGMATLVQHRVNEKADYTLIVAPEYEEGQLENVAGRERCAPMRAKTLAKLLMLTVRAGGVDLGRFEALFERHDPESVDRFVQTLIDQQSEAPRPSLPLVLGVLTSDDFGEGDPVTAQVLHDRLRRNGHVEETSSWRQLFALFLGLEVLIPKLIRTEAPDRIWFATSPERVLAAVTQQISVLPEEYRLGIDAFLQ